MGGLSAVDRALVKTQGNINDLRSTYDAMKAKAAALTFTDKFFNGSNATDPNEFDGLKNRLTGSQVIDMGAHRRRRCPDPGQAGRVHGCGHRRARSDSMNKTMRRKISTLVRASGQAIETVS